MKTQKLQKFQKPKVLIIIDTYYIGGAGKVILQFLTHADFASFDYILASFCYRNPPSTEFIDAAKKQGCNLRLFSQRFFLDPSPIFQIFSLIRKERINIIESHGYKGHLLGWLVAKFLSVKRLGVTHGWTNENRRVRFYNRLDRMLLKGADHVISVSPELKAVMIRIRGRKDTSLVLNAVDEQSIVGVGKGEEIRSRVMKTKLTTVIGVFGRLSPEKGHINLLLACKSILHSQDTVLLIVGDGQEAEALRQQAYQLGVSDRVVFEGQQQNMRDYYQAIDLLVLASLSEGLPFVVLEAMAMGKPVLATNVGAVGDVIEHEKNGWLVEPGSVEKLESQLREILKIRKKLPEYGVCAKQSLYPRFLPKRQAEEVVAIYEKLIA